MMSKIKLYLENDKVLSLIFWLSVFLQSISVFWSTTYNIVDFSLLSQIFAYIRVFVLFFGCCIIVICKNKISTVFFLNIILTVFALSIIFYPENNTYLLFTLKTFFPIAGMILLLSNIHNLDYFFDRLLFFSKAYVGFVTIILIILSFSNSLVLFAKTSYMNFSYTLLPFVCGMIGRIIIGYKKIIITDIFFSFIGLLLMVVWGARGALISVFAYCISLILKKVLRKKQISSIYKYFAFCVVLLLFVNFMINTFELESRNVEKIVKYNSSDASGLERLDIYNKLLSELNDSPIFPRGINADFTLLGTYSHNIFIEILYSFGGIFGSAFVTVIILLSIKTLFCLKDNLYTNAILYFFSISFYRLLVSSSLFFNPYFWCWLFLILRPTGQKFMLSYSKIHKA